MSVLVLFKLYKLSCFCILFVHDLFPSLYSSSACNWPLCSYVFMQTNLIWIEFLNLTYSTMLNETVTCGWYITGLYDSRPDPYYLPHLNLQTIFLKNV
jgi:hypothetical protein